MQDDEAVNISIQMTSTDKDFRFMATNDLMTELQKDSIKLDDDSERKVGVKLTAGVMDQQKWARRSTDSKLPS